MDNSEIYTSQTSIVTRIFRTKTNEIRLIWIFIIIPVYFLSTIILNRVIFILIQVQFNIMEGYSQELALQRAQTQMMLLESQVVLCVIDSLLMLLLVFY